MAEFSSAVVQRHMICEQEVRGRRGFREGAKEWNPLVRFSPAHQIRGQAQTSELSDAVLGRFGLLLSGGAGLRRKKKKPPTPNTRF